MIKKFAREEKGQSGIEYILIVGGIIAAAVVIVSLYSNMVSSAGSSINESVGTKIEDIGSTINSS